MKKNYKIVFIIILLMIVSSLENQAYASDIWKSGSDFIGLGQNGTGPFSSGGVTSKFEELIDFLWGLGLLTIFISTVVLGIKYMLVLPEEKSRIKQATTPYVIGVGIIFGALTIWKFIIYVLESAL